MKNYGLMELPKSETEKMTIHSTDKNVIVNMASRVCDCCGKTKDIYGGKTCSKGHFICHSCASGHVHCPLDGHTLR